MIKIIDDELYQTVCEWGKNNHEFTILPKHFLPHGYISYLNDKPIIAAFMYVTTDLTMGFIAYVITNPNSDKSERDQCFEELINAFEQRAKDMNVKFLFTTTNNGSLTNRFRNIDFIECDTDVVHLVKQIK